MKEERDLSVVISNVLRYGIIVSSLLIASGVVLMSAKAPSGFPASVEQLVTSNYGRPTLDMWTLLRGVASLQGLYVTELGIIILLATPVTRVATSVFIFAAEKDRLYVVITLFVLVVLLVGIFVVGPIEAHAA